jgi:hypothetical protein
MDGRGREEEEGKHGKMNAEIWMASWFTLMGYLKRKNRRAAFQQMTRHCCSLAAFPYHQGARMFHSLGLLLLAGLVASHKLSCFILKLVA